MSETKHTPGPWSVCGKGKCSCMTIMCADYPVAKVTCGNWGDDYPTVQLEGGLLERKAVAVMEQITYGEVFKETAEANCHLIAAAPEMLAALKNCERTLQGKAQDPRDATLMGVLKYVIAKAEGRAQ